ncbi:hypothetical protein NTH_04564 (plasmid) [Nitratireductor thuwali]|uniref:Uncharacterized protein n=1 Tax=Nitratireductor thuwali TaxID=2267699 RepID=A0ABY5MRW3_9HYPH|nr:hypothetical protein NTH_04564 [Nitratireductor thuwali]
MTGRHVAAGEGKKSPALGIRGAQLRFCERHSVNGNGTGDLNPLSLRCSDGLDQRAQPSRASPRTQISPLPCERECGRWRRADYDEIADGNLAVERHNPPDPERVARRKIDAQATYITEGEQADHCSSADPENGERATPAGHLSTWD